MVATCDPLDGEVAGAGGGAGGADAGEDAGIAGVFVGVCGGATHLVQTVMVLVRTFVESTVATWTEVVPAWVSVLVTGQLVTVV